MKTKRTRLLLSILMIACLITGCAFGEFDASGYVKACLDANVHGEFDDYAKITNSTTAEVEKLYNDFLDSDLSFLTAYNADDATQQKFRDLFIKLYKNMKYEVGESTKADDGSYSVPVTVYKMVVFKNVMDNMESEMTKWAESMVNAGTTPSMDEIYSYVLDYMYDSMSKEVDNPQYDEPTTINVKVAKNSDNVYAIDQTELQNLLESMIDIENTQ